MVTVYSSWIWDGVLMQDVSSIQVNKIKWKTVWRPLAFSKYSQQPNNKKEKKPDKLQ